MVVTRGHRRGWRVALALAAAAPGLATAGAPPVAARAVPAARPAALHRPSSDDASGRVHAQLAARMPLADAAVRARLGRTIMEEAQRAGLDPLLVLALIDVESSFDPDAVSSAGALGLMQLRGPTLRRELERAGLPVTDPSDPEASVRAGVRYLRRLIDAFGGLDVALMAYNAGPNRILAHLRAGGIPERFHVYPRKVRAALARLRGGRAVAMADASPARVE